MKKDEIKKLYIDHHIKGNKYGFVYGGDERGRLISNWIGSGKKVLDLGCRDGALTKFFTKNNTVIGIDVDTNALKQCEKKLKIKTYFIDINNGLPFEKYSFDTVVMGEVLEHTFSPKYVLKEVYRVLKKRGILIGSVPNSFRLKNRLLFLIGKKFDPDDTHLHRFSRNSLKSLLQNEKFDSIIIKPIASRFLFLSPILFANILLWRCIKK